MLVQVQKQSETNQPVPFKLRIMLPALQKLEIIHWALIECQNTHNISIFLKASAIIIQDSQSIQNTCFQSSWCSQCFKLHGIELCTKKMSATKVQQKNPKSMEKITLERKKIGFGWLKLGWELHSEHLASSTSQLHLRLLAHISVYDISQAARMLQVRSNTLQLFQ